MRSQFYEYDKEAAMYSGVSLIDFTLEEAKELFEEIGNEDEIQVFKIKNEFVVFGYVNAKIMYKEKLKFYTDVIEAVNTLGATSLVTFINIKERFPIYIPKSPPIKINTFTL